MSVQADESLIRLDEHGDGHLHLHGEPGGVYLAVPVSGRIFIQPVANMSAEELAMWREHPEVMVPPELDPGYPESLVRLGLDDL